MKAPCNDNYPLGINSSCTYDWSLAIMVLTMIFPFDSIYKQRGALVFYQSTIEFKFYRIPPSRINPLVSRRYCVIAPPLMNSSWCDTFHRFFASTGSRLSSTENTEYLLFAIPFLDVVAIRWHPLKPLDMMCRGPHHPWTFPSVY